MTISFSRLLLGFILTFTFSLGTAASLPTQAPPPDLKGFVREIHHQLEGKGLAAALNPKRILLEAKRVKNIAHSNPGFLEHAKNLALLLPISESLELSTGPAINWLVLNTDFPSWLEGLMLGGGYLVSTPFVVEPYCATLIFSYSAFPKFRNGVTHLRVGLASMATTACQRTGIQVLYERLFPKKDLIDGMLRSGWEIQFSDDLSTFTALIEGIKIVFRLTDQPYVGLVQVTQPMPKRVLRKKLKALNWSARELLLQDFQKTPYEKIYRANEILVSPRRRTCQELIFGT